MQKKLLVSLLFSCFIYHISQAQDKLVSGVVTYASAKAPARGTWVAIKGTQINTYTDSIGHYSITVPTGATLVFSVIGAAMQEEIVGKRTRINVALKDSNKPGEVIYGSPHKSTIPTKPRKRTRT